MRRRIYLHQNVATGIALRLLRLWTPSQKKRSPKRTQGPSLRPQQRPRQRCRPPLTQTLRRLLQRAIWVLRASLPCQAEPCGAGQQRRKRQRKVRRAHIMDQDERTPASSLRQYVEHALMHANHIGLQLWCSPSVNIHACFHLHQRFSTHKKLLHIRRQASASQCFVWLQMQCRTTQLLERAAQSRVLQYQTVQLLKPSLRQPTLEGEPLGAPPILALMPHSQQSLCARPGVQLPSRRQPPSLQTLVQRGQLLRPRQLLPQRMQFQQRQS